MFGGSNGYLQYTQRTRCIYTACYVHIVVLSQTTFSDIFELTFSVIADLFTLNSLSILFYSIHRITNDMTFFTVESLYTNNWRVVNSSNNIINIKLDSLPVRNCNLQLKHTASIRRRFTSNDLCKIPQIKIIHYQLIHYVHTLNTEQTENDLFTANCLAANIKCRCYSCSKPYQ